MLVEEEIKDNSSRRLLTIIFVVLFVVCGVFVYFLATDTNLFGSKNIAKEDNTSKSDADKDKKENKEEEISGEDSKNDLSKKSEDKEKNKINREPDPEIEAPKFKYEITEKLLKGFQYIPTTPANLNSVLVKTPSSRYYVILGSFGKPENAYSYYNNLVSRSVPNVKILAPNDKVNLYRISCGDYPTRNEARIRGEVFGKANGLRYIILKY